eukprot:scaffold10787_cov123-Isochrysis_galbana.AAC.2
MNYLFTAEAPREMLRLFSGRAYRYRILQVAIGDDELPIRFCPEYWRERLLAPAQHRVFLHFGTHTVMTRSTSDVC